MTTVAAAIIINEAGEILLCRRGAGGSCAHLWEFPGGKLEPGETPEQCVVRECREELQIEIALTRRYFETSYKYPEQKISFVFFLARIVAGVPAQTVHEALAWAHPAQLGTYTFCPADTALVQQLAQEACL